MHSETLTIPDAQEILDALPVFAMVLDEDHRIVMSNSWFAGNTGDAEGVCPVACYERVHGTDGPHPDCPLVESARTGRSVARTLSDDSNGTLSVTVVPFKGRFGGQRLFLHLTQMK